jgi:hypothetical protein
MVPRPTISGRHYPRGQVTFLSSEFTFFEYCTVEGLFLLGPVGKSNCNWGSKKLHAGFEKLMADF